MKRRSFLGKSATLTLALSTFPSIHIISKKQKDKLGIALVGLGNYATNQLAPALQETNRCYLAGIVTGTPSKATAWKEKYKIPAGNIYNYSNFDKISGNNDIDIVYVVLPNNMHAEYSIRAANAGKHVISEKPMATNYADCQKMISASKKANKKLSIGYRLHFDPFNLEIMRLGQKKIFGQVLETEAGFGFPLRDKKRWRLDKKMAGGGPLMDVGIYAMQGTIYMLGELPTAVTAKDITSDKVFYGDVEGTLEWSFEFSSGVKNSLETSYERYFEYTKTQCESGSFELHPAFMFNGLAGKTSDGPMSFSAVNQQALQMDDFARCVMDDRESIVKGEMGARDMFIVEKIYNIPLSESAGVVS